MMEDGDAMQAAAAGRVIVISGGDGSLFVLSVDVGLIDASLSLALG